MTPAATLADLQATVRHAVDMLERGQARQAVEMLRAAVLCPPPFAHLDPTNGSWTGPDDGAPDAE